MKKEEKEKNLEKIYQRFVDKNEVTTKELNLYGFNSNDINELIKENILIRISRGHYTVIFNALYEYSKKCRKNKQYENADKTLFKCHELEPDNQFINFKLFYYNVISENYEKAFYFLDKIYDSENEIYDTNNNFYLFLLSLVTEVPEKYKNDALYTSYQHIKLDENDNNNLNVLKENEIRMLALNHKFIKSLEMLESFEQEKKKTYHITLIKILLNRAYEVQIKNRNMMQNLIEKKEYEKVLKFLNVLKSKQRLSYSEKLILTLTNSYMYIKKNNIVPKKKPFKYKDSIMALINANSYQEALKLIQNKNFSSNSILYRLLEEINKLINEIESKMEQENNVSNTIIEEDKKQNSNNTKKLTNIINENKSSIVEEKKEDFIKTRSHLEQKKLLNYAAKLYNNYNMLYDALFTEDELKNIILNAISSYSFNTGLNLELYCKFKIETDIINILKDRYQKNKDSEESLQILMILEEIYRNKLKLRYINQNNSYCYINDSEISSLIEKTLDSFDGNKPFYTELSLNLKKTQN